MIELLSQLNNMEMIVLLAPIISCLFLFIYILLHSVKKTLPEQQGGEAEL